MGQDVLPASHCQFHIQRQAVQILKDLLPYRLLYVFQVIVCDLTAISVPQGLFAAIVILRPILVFRRGVVECVQHHQFVVSKKHLGVWHCHDLTEDFDAVRVAVYHIAKDIERVLGLQVDLFHDGIKAPLLPVDIRHYINHGVPPPSLQHEQIPHF